ncbi:MAG: hypothetical protein OHK0011_17490 [Turneriella sp.]
MVLVCTGCNSLLNEAERIRNAYLFKNSEAPAVVATDPADGGTGSTTQTYIDITFSIALDSSSATVQPANGACTGSLQFSTDNFATCLGGSLDTSANPRLRFTPVMMPRGVVIRLRVLPSLLNLYGKPAESYNSPQGMTFSALCGASNCFFSTSLPLLTGTGSASAMFLIRSGTHAGKLVIMTEGQTTTTMVDFIAISTGPGPTLPMAPGAGLHTFPILQGPHAGKEMVFMGGTLTYLYDPATHTFTAGPAPAGINAGAFTFTPVAGIYAGHAFTLNGAPSTTVNRYPDNLGNFIHHTTLAGPNLPGVGGHALRTSAGTAASYFFLVFGNNNTASRFFDEGTGNILAGPTLSGNAGAGAGSFVVESGPLAGRILTVLGGGSNATNRYDIASAVNEGSGPTLTPAVDAGGQVLYRFGTNLASAPLVLHGGGLAGITTSRFDAASGAFTAGPLSHGAIGAGSSTLFIPSTTDQGYFFIVNGLTLSNTQIYSLSNNDFFGNTLPGSTPNNGAHAFYVEAGIHRGRTLVIAAGSSRHTALYDPSWHAFFQGPLTVDPISASGFSIPITRGTYAGRVVVFAGGGANTYNVYNPGDATFRSMLDLSHVVSGTPLPTTSGANFFEMSDGRILILNGGGVTTQILDQENYTFVTTGTPVASCIVTQSFNLRYTRPSDGRAMQLVWCNGSLFTVFDHVTQTFSLHSVAGGGTGLQAFVIPSGTERGNIALVHGGNSTNWRILSAEDLSTIGGVRSLAGCTTTGVEAGSQLIPITSGSNAGRHLLVVGNTTRNTCLFDPTTLAFTTGPAIGNVNSPGYPIVNGSVAFATRGGAYPTGAVLLSGTNKNVWSTFVP